MADLPTSPLAERLLRRATDPLGVVDVRSTVSRYERATAWPRQHLAAVERPVSRIQLEAQAEQRPPMTLAAVGSMQSARDLLETTGGASAHMGAGGPATTPISLMRSVRQGSEPGPRAASGVPDSSGTASRAASSVPAATHDASPTTVVGPAMHAVSRIRLDRRGASASPTSPRSAPSTSEPQGAVVERRGDVGVASEAPASSPVRMEMARVAAVRSGGPSSAAEVMRRTPSVGAHERAAVPTLSPPVMPQPLVQRPLVDRGAIPVVTPPTARLAAGSTQASLQRLEAGASETAMVAESGKPASRSLVARSQAPSGITTLQPGVPSTVGPVVARTLAGARQTAAQAAPDAMVLRSAIAPDATRSERPTARAATGAPGASAPAGVQLVWRRGATAEPNAVLARSLASPAGAHSVPNGASSTTTPQQGVASGGGSTISSAASHQSPVEKGSPPINVDQLAQEIMRRIVEQFAIQRERLGEPWR